MNNKILLFVTVFSVVVLMINHRPLQAQVTLSTSPYTQNFNSIASGIPTGWTVRTGATSASEGAAVTLVTTATSWATTSPNFRNVASTTGLNATSTVANQSNSPDRALALRQTGTFGDAGAAFVLQLANTTGFSNFQLAFQLLSLDASIGRTTTWKVQYATGAAPTTFTDAVTSPTVLTTSNAWGSTEVTVNFGAALDNIADPVWIRLVTLSVTTGAGNRPTSAIDDVSLSFAMGDITPPDFSYSYPRFSDYTTTGATLAVNLNEPGKVYYAIVPDGELALSPEQIKNGQYADGNSLPTGFHDVIDVTVSETVFGSVIGNLNDASDYDVYLIAEDAAFNLQAEAYVLKLHTNKAGDVSPPVFTTGYPKITNVTSSGFFLYYSQEEYGTLYYVVLPQGAAVPTSAQVKQGVDASNTALPEERFGSSVVNTINSERMDKIDDLLSNTSYDVYIVAEDNVPNLQSSPVKIAVTTAPAYAENFNACDGTSSFTSYSVAGDQTWGCVDFGYSSTKALRINGFSGSAVVNEDWLISPLLSLQADAVMSFYSQFSFAGNGLQLKISSGYSGSGNPSLATWTDLNGGFPSVAVGSNSTSLSDWTFSEVDLSAYANQKVYIAFVYTSTAAAAARWTLDEVEVRNALPAYLSITPSSLQFISSGTTKSYTLKGVNLESDVIITAPAYFSVSKDNTAFTNSITYTAAEVSTPKTVFVKFEVASPATETVTGVVTHTSANAPSRTLSVKGTDKSQTLDIVTYNLEFFGTDVKDASNVEFGPLDDALQVANVTSVMQSLGADIFAVEEIADDNAFDQLVTNLSGYDKIVSSRWSYSFDPPDPKFPPQKIGFIYNTSTVQLVSSRVMFAGMYDAIKAGTTTLPSYPGGTSSSFWSSGRLPFMATFDVTIQGTTRRIRMITIHSKSGSAQADYDRRKYDVKVLHDSLVAHYPHDNIILLGDFNDDVDSSILTGAESTYKIMVEDTDNFKALTYPLSQSGAGSFPSSNSFLDHIIISDELFNAYLINSTAVEDARNLISNYVNTTSDHLPVSTRLLISQKADQVITFAAIADKVLGDAPFNLSATSSSALSVNYSTTSDKVTINNNQVTLVKSGRASISANQAGNADYNAAVSVPQSFCIQPPKPVITLTSASTESPLLTSNAPSGNQWYLNGAIISGATNTSYHATVSGAYQVQVKVDDCTSELSNQTAVIVTGVESLQPGIAYYPNPVQEELMISGLTNSATAIYVFDMTGREKVVQLEKVEENLHRVDVSELIPGLYLGRIKTGTSQVQIRFIKR